MASLVALDVAAATAHAAFPGANGKLALTLNGAVYSINPDGSARRA